MTPETEYHYRTHTLRGYLATYRDEMRGQHGAAELTFGWTVGLALALMMFWTVSRP